MVSQWRRCQFSGVNTKMGSSITFKIKGTEGTLAETGQIEDIFTTLVSETDPNSALMEVLFTISSANPKEVLVKQLFTIKHVIF